MIIEQIPAVEMKNITKSFRNTKANDRICFSVNHGEVMSLLGENGSGKTTLMNMLSGIYHPDEGQIFVDGREVSIASPKDALDLKIGMIHQHFKLIDVFSAAENVALCLDEKGKYDIKKVIGEMGTICAKYGFILDPKKKVYEMSVSEKQTLEIIKVLCRGADILILDEPTAVLTPQETEKLFDVIRNMKADGKSVVIITHKLQEVLKISDRVTILRKGQYIGTVNTSEATRESLTEMMVGQKVVLNIEREKVENPELRLEIKNLTVKDIEGVTVLDNVSFDAYGGEILGIAGISGCGQKELLEAIAGIQKTEEGASVEYHAPSGECVKLLGKTPREIKELGITLSFVPEDRLGMGLVGSMGMTENMLLKNYEKGAPVFVHKNESKDLAEKLKEGLSIVTPDITTPVRQLSGGNVQKVLVGREIAAAPSVLMTAYAVRGLDINTSYLIYDLLNAQKKNGVAVIFVGEDLDVMMALCDRILVLCGGKVNGIIDGRIVTKEQIGLLMTNMNEGGQV